MKNADPVINGFSASIIKHLIQLLNDKANECYNNAEKVLTSPEKDAMRTFSHLYTSPIQMIAKWAMIKAPREFKTSVELNGFLLKARIIIDMLTPAE